MTTSSRLRAGFRLRRNPEPRQLKNMQQIHTLVLTIAMFAMALAMAVEIVGLKTKLRQAEMNIIQLQHNVTGIHKMHSVNPNVHEAMEDDIFHLHQQNKSRQLNHGGGITPE